MFANTCADCGQHSLIFPGQITGMHHTSHGIELAYTCWCGSEQTWSADRDASPRRTTRQSVAA